METIIGVEGGGWNYNKVLRTPWRLLSQSYRELRLDEENASMLVERLPLGKKKLVEETVRFFSSCDNASHDHTAPSRVIARSSGVLSK